MKRYKFYKDSGLEWIGEIPDEWSFSRLKYISQIEKGRIPSNTFQDWEEGMVPYLSMDYLRGNTETPEYVSLADPKLTLVSPEDLLVLWDGSKAGEIVKAKEGALSSTMGKIHVESQEFYLPYLSYLLKSSERFLQENTVGMGIPHVNGSVLRSLFIAKPSFKEQSQIAHYLDHHTGLIDQLIEKKKRLVELLEEKRKAVINEAVTKGLNPTVRMKDSGIEWIGEIPEPWEIVRLKYLTELITDGAHISPDISKDDYPFISTVDLNEGEIDWETCLKTSKENYEYLVRTGCKPIKGDVLFSKDGTIGKTALIKENKDFVVASSLIITRVNTEKLNPSFLEFFLNSDLIKWQIESVLSGVAIRRVSLKKFSNLLIILPPKDTQIEMSSFLSTRLQELFGLEKKIINQISLLTEYRQSLISEVVTGKIDVRDW